MSPAHRPDRGTDVAAGGRAATRAFPRRIDYIGAGVLVVATVVWAMFRFGIAKSLLGSPRALLILAAAAVLGVLLAVAVWRTTRRPVVARLIGLLPLLAIFIWSEVLPAVGGGQTARDVDPLAAVAESSTAAPAADTSPATTSAATSAAVPSAAESAGAQRSSSPSSASASTAAPSAPSTPPPTVTTTASPAAKPAPTLLGEGALVGIDHDAAGTVRLVRQPNGSYLVRLQSFTVEPGPAYRLFIVPGPNMQIPQRGIDLGPFGPTRGSVNVAVPGKPALSGPVTVLIWCDVYAVPIANATIDL